MNIIFGILIFLLGMCAASSMIERVIVMSGKIALSDNVYYCEQEGIK